MMNFKICMTAECIEGVGKKHTKYFANLEKNRSEAKTLHNLEKEGVVVSDQSVILNELKAFCKKKTTTKKQQQQQKKRIQK